MKLSDEYIESYDQNNNLTYFQDNTNPDKPYWEEYTYDNQGHEIHYLNSDGFSWVKGYGLNTGELVFFSNSDGDEWQSQFDDKGREIYFLTDYDYWQTKEFDDNDMFTHFENSDGKRVDFDEATSRYVVSYGETIKPKIIFYNDINAKKLTRQKKYEEWNDLASRMSKPPRTKNPFGPGMIGRYYEIL